MRGNCSKCAFRLNGGLLFAMVHAALANDLRRVALEHNANAPLTTLNYFQTRNFLNPPTKSSRRWQRMENLCESGLHYPADYGFRQESVW